MKQEVLINLDFILPLEVDESQISDTTKDELESNIRNHIYNMKILDIQKLIDDTKSFTVTVLNPQELNFKPSK